MRRRNNTGLKRVSLSRMSRAISARRADRFGGCLRPPLLGPDAHSAKHYQGIQSFSPRPRARHRRHVGHGAVGFDARRCLRPAVVHGLGRGRAPDAAAGFHRDGVDRQDDSRGSPRVGAGQRPGSRSDTTPTWLGSPMPGPTAVSAGDGSGDRAGPIPPWSRLVDVLPNGYFARPPPGAGSGLNWRERRDYLGDRLRHAWRMTDAGMMEGDLSDYDETT
jgi:hypothetical protein